MKNRKFRLLSKVVLFYLIITLSTFIISAVILQKEANKHMNNILEHRFGYREHYVRRLLRENPEKINRISHTSVSEVESIPNNFVPAYRDTLITNEQTQREDVFRKKIMYLTIDGKHYRVEMSKGAEELYRFKDDIFNVILPMLGALVIVIVLANFILSGYLLEPFRRILKQMSLYKIGQPTPTDEISTSTKEFHQLKLLYDKMQRRIENDYYQLKEYTENMSHELQTPLAIIQNKTESLLSESRLQEDQAKKLKVIHDEIQQLSRLGSALNLITKIENNEFRNIQTVHTAPVIRKHIDKIEEIAVMKKLKIELLLDETHSFTIDPGLYDILIRNLIKNALQYSRDETTILFKTEQGKLIITNQGSKLEFPKNEIFTRFKKGNGSQSVGLGLAIVKKICAVSQLQIDYIQQVETHRFEIYHNHT